MNKFLYIVLLLLHFPFFSQAEETFCFRVYLADKGSIYSASDDPANILSLKAIQRREKHAIFLNDSDRPVSDAYLDSLTGCGGTVVTRSKWLSTVVIASADSSIADRLTALPMVDSVKWVWKGISDHTGEIGNHLQTDTSRMYPNEQKLKTHYGYADPQISMLNGKKLHAKGFTGKGMSIAVIDVGFTHVDRIAAFDSLNLAGTYNFTNPAVSVFQGDDHGTKVLSCLAANLPGIMVGTAPHATYWLLKSEDNRSEYPIEEDYWVAAVEFADSVGVDIISSSLGYFHFDEDEMNYSQDLLNGKTAFISRAAEIAAQKGILVICSAGNEGSNYWEKITFPSDADHILTIGAITDEKEKSSFSSTGFTSDFRIKPDLVALGSSCSVIDRNGNLRYASGTSFSTPIIAGLAACLWEALPGLNSQELISLLQETASQAKQPDAEVGYGIPNIYKAYKKKKNESY